MVPRRRVGPRRPRLPPREEVEAADGVPLSRIGDEVDPAIELAHDLEDAVLEGLAGQVPEEAPADAQVHRGTRILRDERVGGLPDTVVEEPVRVVDAEE
jgi:hypothetical protein